MRVVGQGAWTLESRIKRGRAEGSARFPTESSVKSRAAKQGGRTCLGIASPEQDDADHDGTGDGCDMLVCATIPGAGRASAAFALSLVLPLA